MDSRFNRGCGGSDEASLAYTMLRDLGNAFFREGKIESKSSAAKNWIVFLKRKFHAPPIDLPPLNRGH